MPAMSLASIRNICIIAHVDHGKTTLVDNLLRQSGHYRENQVLAERAMDSMDLEREKGITIKAKNACVNWNGHLVNIVDTPGHADFGGEVERILRMVDGALLVVDAVEGPQAQTRFVLKKAIENRLKIMVVINKIDREQADPARVHEQVLELLLELHANEDQFNAPFLYASARNGYALAQLGDPIKDMRPLFEAVVTHIPPPRANPEAPFELLVSNLDWSDYVGRIGIGKITGGSVKRGDTLYAVHKDGRREAAKVTKIFTFTGMGTAEIESAGAGQIVGIAGFEDLGIGECMLGQEDQPALPFLEIDPPTIRMQLAVNDGPLAGQDGKFVTARQIGERLRREARVNVSLDVRETENSNVYEVNARGELQIAILVETMRREGFELLVSRPEVILREENGVKLEPYETLWLDVPENKVGDIMQTLSPRKGRVVNMEHRGGRVLLEAVIPTRGLIGYEAQVVNLTSGHAVMSHMFKEYGALAGEIPSRISGALISMEAGVATGYALDTIQQRGKLFIGPGEEVYEGMVIGENARSDDLPVNPTRAKQLTNMRASGADDKIMLEPPTKLSLERAIEFISGDEYVEATPQHLRLRKKILQAHLRKRAAKG
jgi:GTP-binding protein